MEDEDAKIRRNLVAFAGAIVLLAWLKVPMDVITERLLGIGAKPGFLLSQKRVWLASGAILVYLGLRHRFSEVHKAGVEAMKEDWEVVETRLLRLWLRAEAALMNRMKKARPPLIGGFEGIMTQVSVAKGAQPPVLARCVFEGAYRGSNISGGIIDRSRSVTISLRVEELVDGKLRPLKSVALVGQIGRFGRILKFCATALWVAFYSRTSLSFLAPWALAALAGILILRRLWQIW